ncbi:MAG: hypothetical protein ACPG5Z_00185 [Pseudoalteromonas sp.]
MIESKSVEFAKEIDDIMLLVIQVVKDLKEGKDVSELVSSNLGGLLAAIEGADQADDEYKENLAAAMATVGYRAGELGAALLEKKEEVPAE